MKRILYLVALFFCFIPKTVFSQQRIQGCSYDGNQVNTGNLCQQLKFNSNSEAESAIDDMLKQIGLKRNFAIMECPGTENCMAVTIEGIRFIIYDNAFLSKFKTYQFAEVALPQPQKQNADWAAISIMAHEVGHHLNGHTLQEGGSKPDLELEADEFSGFILYKLGASLEQAQQAMRNPMISDYGSFTHPPRQQRLNAIAQGWNNAKNLSAPDLPQWKDQPDLPQMNYIEGGSFDMGYQSLSLNSLDEIPVHNVILSGFYMGQTEVTVAQYRAFCTATSRNMPFPVSWGWNDAHPIVNVSWDDANAYCIWLSTVTGNKYRLPTEAEWEYAARAGNRSSVLDYPFSGSLMIDEVAWYKDNAVAQTHAVALKKPNTFGLFDMTGNVWEWCNDWYDAAYYLNSSQTNPAGPYFGERKVLRGGSWANTATDCSVYDRDSGIPSLGLHFTGFRVVKEE